MADIDFFIYTILTSILVILFIIGEWLTHDDEPIINPDWEHLLKGARKILEPKICEYCEGKYEEGERYCHLCGSGLKE